MCARSLVKVSSWTHIPSFQHDDSFPGEPSSQNANLKTCSRCYVVTYCSKSCQEADWIALHRHECSNLLQLYSGSLRPKASSANYPLVFFLTVVCQGIAYFTAQVNPGLLSPRGATNYGIWSAYPTTTCPLFPL